MEEIDDNYPFPFGMHRDKPIGKLPADYLIWVLENVNTLEPRILKYLKDVESVLRKEIADKKARNKPVSDSLRESELAERDKFMQRYDR